VTEWEKKNKSDAYRIINNALDELIGKPLGMDLISDAMGRMDPSTVLMQDRLYKCFTSAVKSGFIEPGDSIEGIFDEKVLPAAYIKFKKYFIKK
jgi:hypothetical protein